MICRYRGVTFPLLLPFFFGFLVFGFGFGIPVLYPLEECIGLLRSAGLGLFSVKISISTLVLL